MTLFFVEFFFPKMEYFIVKQITQVRIEILFEKTEN